MPKDRGARCVDPTRGMEVIWVMQGRTEHMAYLIEENENGWKRIRWASTQATAWIEPDVEIRKDLGGRSSRRRGAPQAFVPTENPRSKKKERLPRPTTTAGRQQAKKKKKQSKEVNSDEDEDDEMNIVEMKEKPNSPKEANNNNNSKSKSSKPKKDMKSKKGKKERKSTSSASYVDSDIDEEEEEELFDWNREQKRKSNSRSSTKNKATKREKKSSSSNKSSSRSEKSSRKEKEKETGKKKAKKAAGAAKRESKEDVVVDAGSKKRKLDNLDDSDYIVSEGEEDSLDGKDFDDYDDGSDIEEDEEDEEMDHDVIVKPSKRPKRNSVEKRKDDDYLDDDAMEEMLEEWNMELARRGEDERKPPAKKTGTGRPRGRPRKDASNNSNNSSSSEDKNIISAREEKGNNTNTTTTTTSKPSVAMLLSDYGKGTRVAKKMPDLGWISGKVKSATENYCTIVWKQTEVQDFLPKAAMAQLVYDADTTRYPIKTKVKKRMANGKAKKGRVHSLDSSLYHIMYNDGTTDVVGTSEMDELVATKKGKKAPPQQPLDNSAVAGEATTTTTKDTKQSAGQSTEPEATKRRGSDSPPMEAETEITTALGSTKKSSKPKEVAMVEMERTNGSEEDVVSATKEKSKPIPEPQSANNNDKEKEKETPTAARKPDPSPRSTSKNIKQISILNEESTGSLSTSKDEQQEMELASNSSKEVPSTLNDSIKSPNGKARDPPADPPALANTVDTHTVLGGMPSNEPTPRANAEGVVPMEVEDVDGGGNSINQTGDDSCPSFDKPVLPSMEKEKLNTSGGNSDDPMDLDEASPSLALQSTDERIGTSLVKAGDARKEQLDSPPSKADKQEENGNVPTKCQDTGSISVKEGTAIKPNSSTLSTEVQDKEDSKKTDDVNAMPANEIENKATAGTSTESGSKMTGEAGGESKTLKNPDAKVMESPKTPRRKFRAGSGSFAGGSPSSSTFSALGRLLGLAPSSMSRSPARKQKAKPSDMQRGRKDDNSKAKTADGSMTRDSTDNRDDKQVATSSDANDTTKLSGSAAPSGVSRDEKETSNKDNTVISSSPVTDSVLNPEPKPRSGASSSHRTVEAESEAPAMQESVPLPLAAGTDVKSKKDEKEAAELVLDRIPIDKESKAMETSESCKGDQIPHSTKVVPPQISEPDPMEIDSATEGTTRESQKLSLGSGKAMELHSQPFSAYQIETQSKSQDSGVSVTETQPPSELLPAPPPTPPVAKHKSGTSFNGAQGEPDKSNKAPEAANPAPEAANPAPPSIGLAQQESDKSISINPAATAVSKAPEAAKPTASSVQAAQQESDKLNSTTLAASAVSRPLEAAKAAPSSSGAGQEPPDKSNSTTPAAPVVSKAPEAAKPTASSSEAAQQESNKLNSTTLAASAVSKPLEAAKAAPSSSGAGQEPPDKSNSTTPAAPEVSKASEAAKPTTSSSEAAQQESDKLNSTNLAASAVSKSPEAAKPATSSIEAGQEVSVKSNSTTPAAPAVSKAPEAAKAAALSIGAAIKEFEKSISTTAGSAVSKAPEASKPVASSIGVAQEFDKSISTTDKQYVTLITTPAAFAVSKPSTAAKAAKSSPTGSARSSSTSPGNAKSKKAAKKQKKPVAGGKSSKPAAVTTKKKASISGGQSKRKLASAEPQTKNKRAKTDGKNTSQNKAKHAVVAKGAAAKGSEAAKKKLASGSTNSRPAVRKRCADPPGFTKTAGKKTKGTSSGAPEPANKNKKARDNISPSKVQNPVPKGVGVGALTPRLSASAIARMNAGQSIESALEKARSATASASKNHVISGKSMVSTPKGAGNAPPQRKNQGPVGVGMGQGQISQAPMVAQGKVSPSKNTPNMSSTANAPGAQGAPGATMRAPMAGTSFPPSAGPGQGMGGPGPGPRTQPNQQHAFGSNSAPFGMALPNHMQWGQSNINPKAGAQGNFNSGTSNGQSGRFDDSTNEAMPNRSGNLQGPTSQVGGGAVDQRQQLLSQLQSLAQSAHPSLYFAFGRPGAAVGGGFNNQGMMNAPQFMGGGGGNMSMSTARMVAAAHLGILPPQQPQRPPPGPVNAPAPAVPNLAAYFAQNQPRGGRGGGDPPGRR